MVWQRAHEMVLDVYKLLQSFPKIEVYSLVDQIKRAAYSVPANIVEGCSKKSKKEFRRYLYISRGSLEELRYFLLLSRDLNDISREEQGNFEEKLTEISYLLNQLIKSLTSTTSRTSITSRTSRPLNTSKNWRKT
ncbi:MAG: four helix bundle protein [Desulfonauticus sp.]|nr:four helix bundle protein [Desulfonauticus sp.]